MHTCAPPSTSRAYLGVCVSLLGYPRNISGYQHGPGFFGFQGWQYFYLPRDHHCLFTSADYFQSGVLRNTGRPRLSCIFKNYTFQTFPGLEEFFIVFGECEINEERMYQVCGEFGKIQCVMEIFSREKKRNLLRKYSKVFKRGFMYIKI